MSDADQPPSGSTPPPPPPPPPQPVPSYPAPGPLTPPPGYVAYGAPGAAMSSQFQPVKRFTTALVALQAVGMVVSLVAAIWQARLVDDAQRFLDGVITRREFENAFDSFSQFSFISLPVALAVIVLSAIWSYRIAGNLTSAGRAPLTWKSGFTILVWVFGCLLGILPFLLLREHWRASDPELGYGDPAWKSRPVSPLVTAWFVTNLVGQLASIAAAGSVMSNFDPDAADDATTLAKQFADQSGYIIPGTILALAASVLLIMVVRALSARHMRLTHEA